MTPKRKSSSFEDEIITLQPLSKKPRIGNPDLTIGEISSKKGDLLDRLATFLPIMKTADKLLEAEKNAGTIDLRRIELIDSESSGDDDDDDDDDDEEWSESGSKDNSEIASGSSWSLNSDSSGSNEGEANEDDSSPVSDEELDEKGINKNISEAIIAQLLKPPTEYANPQRKKKKQRKRIDGPYIEMNLGLGVLEEIKHPEAERDLLHRVLSARRNAEAHDNSEVNDGRRSEDSGVNGQHGTKEETLNSIISDRLQGISSTAQKRVVIEEL